MSFHDPLHSARFEDLEKAVALLNKRGDGRFRIDRAAHPRLMFKVRRDEVCVFEGETKTDLYRRLCAFARGLSWQQTM